MLFFDRVGNTLNIGDIVAYGPRSGGINIGVFIGVQEKHYAAHPNYPGSNHIIKASTIVKPKMKIKNYRKKVQTVVLQSGAISFYDDEKVTEFTFTELVVIKKPEYHIDSEEICGCLEIADEIRTNSTSESEDDESED